MNINQRLSQRPQGAGNSYPRWIAPELELVTAAEMPDPAQREAENAFTRAVEYADSIEQYVRSSPPLPMGGDTTARVNFVFDVNEATRNVIGGLASYFEYMASLQRSPAQPVKNILRPTIQAAEYALGVAATVWSTVEQQNAEAIRRAGNNPKAAMGEYEYWLSQFSDWLDERYTVAAEKGQDAFEYVKEQVKQITEVVVDVKVPWMWIGIAGSAALCVLVGAIIIAR